MLSDGRLDALTAERLTWHRPATHAATDGSCATAALEELSTVAGVLRSLPAQRLPCDFSLLRSTVQWKPVV